ncbi:MAG TPA: hypothetical protein VGQ00_03430 [Candidatus Norongarragalinales archaeon]|nr:hypothetical protein [Candidatus Norongarragalinales archaeon]
MSEIRITHIRRAPSASPPRQYRPQRFVNYGDVWARFRTWRNFETEFKRAFGNTWPSRKQLKGHQKGGQFQNAIMFHGGAQRVRQNLGMIKKSRRII